MVGGSLCLHGFRPDAFFVLCGGFFADDEVGGVSGGFFADVEKKNLDAAEEGRRRAISSAQDCRLDDDLERAAAARQDERATGLEWRLHRHGGFFADPERVDDAECGVRGGFFADRAAVVIEEVPLRAVDGGSLGDAAMEDDKKHLGGKRRDVLAGMRGRDAEEGGSLLEDVLRAMRRLAHDGAAADDRLCKNQAMAERSRFGIRGVAEDLA